MLNTAYLSLGSNIDPEENLKAAVGMLITLTRLVSVSSVWETRPLGQVKQPNFLNAAAIIKTDLSADQLKRNVLDHIEQSLGRLRQIDKYAPRPIDIDIMLFNHQILELGDRHIPDPEVLERPFVAILLAELAPDYQHPETGQTLYDIAKSFRVKNEDMHLRHDISQALTPLSFITINGS